MAAFDIFCGCSLADDCSVSSLLFAVVSFVVTDISEMCCRYIDLLSVGVCISLQQRRHSQVKRWTKHVDLFSKDFIIIPINEEYAACLCFTSHL